MNGCRDPQAAPVGEVVNIHTLHVCLPLFEIEPLNVILLPLMNVDGLGMDGGEGRRKIHLGES